MIPENFILSKWNDQQSIFVTTLQLIRNKPSNKSVHDIRVSIKKIRSYLRLQEHINGLAWKSDFAPVKILFKVSGKLRDFEMSLVLLSEYRQKENIALPSLKKYLQFNKSITSQWTKDAAILFKEENLKILADIMQTSIANFTNDELISKITEEVNNLLKEISLLANNFNKNMHEIRKILKDIYYWLIACPYNPINNLEIKKLEDILQDLGYWQDNFVFSKKLKKVRKEFILKNTIEDDEAKTVAIKIKNTKESLLNKMQKEIETHFL